MKRKKGYTLLELVMALGIIGIVMIPLASSLLTSVTSNKMAETKQESKQISQEIIEKLRNLGDVKEMTMNIGAESDQIEIKEESPLDKTKFSISGNVGDIELSGSISKQTDAGEINEQSDEYAKKQVDILFYIDNNSIRYSYDASIKKTIDEHILDAEKPSSATVQELNGDKLLELIFDKDNDLKVKNDIADGTYKDIKEVAVYVKEARPDDKLISLHLEKSNSLDYISGSINSSNTPKIYFIQNKFSDVDVATGSNPGGNGKLQDSFEKNKTIKGDIDITHNIRYFSKSQRKNKGLYTIKLNLKKDNVREETVSEFVVKN